MVNHRMLSWARDRIGLSIEELAERVTQDVATIKSWESGSMKPTYTQLETLAYQHFKIPLAGLFCAEAPENIDPIAKFRFLPQEEFTKLNFTIRKLINKAAYYQEIIREVSEPDDELSPLLSVMNAKDEVEKSADKLRDFLDYESLSDKAGGRKDLFELLRLKISESNAYVFKEAFKSDDISGFCLPDDSFPVIMINNSSSPGRQLFTLIHELVHAATDSAGILDEDPNYTSRYSDKDKAREKRCNDISNSFFMPNEALISFVEKYKTIDETAISEISDKFYLSREAVMYRLCQIGLFDKSNYSSLRAKWNKEFKDSRADSSGGNWFNNKKSYLGSPYIKLVVDGFHKGKVRRYDLPAYLDVAPKNISGLLSGQYEV